jgi:hypothetical protein
VLLLRIFILLALLTVTVQDIKSRLVYWVLFPLLIVLLLILRLWQGQPISEIWQSVAINSGFLILVIAILTVAYSIKNKRMVNITNELLGWGDVLLLISVTCYLSVLNFLFFYIVSLILVDTWFESAK